MAAAATAAAMREQVHRNSSDMLANIEVKNTFIHYKSKDIGMNEDEEVLNGSSLRRQQSEPAPNLQVKCSSTPVSQASPPQNYCSEEDHCWPHNYAEIVCQKSSRQEPEIEPEIEPSGFLRQDTEYAWSTWDPVWHADMPNASIGARQDSYIDGPSGRKSVPTLPFGWQLEGNGSGCFGPGPGPGCDPWPGLSPAGRGDVDVSCSAGQSPFTFMPTTPTQSPSQRRNPLNRHEVDGQCVSNVNEIRRAQQFQAFPQQNYFPQFPVIALKPIGGQWDMHEDAGKQCAVNFCPDCGERSQPYFKFCKVCGTSLVR